MTQYPPLPAGVDFHHWAPSANWLLLGECFRYRVVVHPGDVKTLENPAKAMARWYAGRFTREDESNNVRSAMLMRPRSGLVNPAMQSSNVDLPAPEGPHRMVNPGGISSETSTTNGA